ncbi:MAG: MTH1187 family thiamine-binding protein [bacterium]
MKATADIQIVVIGEGVSVRDQVEEAVAAIEASGLEYTVHGWGTNVEGEVREVLDLVENLHTALHQKGAVRLNTYLKLGTRTDKDSTLEGKEL